MARLKQWQEVGTRRRASQKSPSTVERSLPPTPVSHPHALNSTGRTQGTEMRSNVRDSVDRGANTFSLRRRPATHVVDGAASSAVFVSLVRVQSNRKSVHQSRM